MFTVFRRSMPFGLMLLLGVAIGYGLSETAYRAEVQAADSGEQSAPACQKKDDCAPKKVMRVGAVIGLKPEMKEKYIRLHANTWPGVLAQIRRSNIRNYSIFLAELEGKLYLFAYYEYVGDDFEADMKAMAADETTQRWWKETDPCQIRLPDTPEGQWWKRIPEVFHTD